MSKKPVTLEDIAAAIGSLQASNAKVEQAIQRLDQQTTKNSRAISSMEIATADTNVMLRDIHEEYDDVLASIDDFSNSLSAMGGFVTEQVSSSEQRIRADLKDVDGRVNELESAQRVSNIRLIHIEDSMLGVGADIKEIYGTLYKFKDDFGDFKDEYKHSNRRLKNFAKKVSVKTGVPYQAS